MLRMTGSGSDLVLGDVLPLPSEGRGAAPAPLRPEETASLQALHFPFFGFGCFFVPASEGGKVLMGSRCLKSKYAQGRGRRMVQAG